MLPLLEKRDLPGVIATGKTKSTVESRIYEAIQFYIEGMKLENIPIPKADTSGEILVFAK